MVSLALPVFLKANFSLSITLKGAFTRHSFWARHSKILARGPIVLGTVRLIYTAKYVRVFSMLISGTAPLKQERHSQICESLSLFDSGSHMISGALSARFRWLFQSRSQRSRSPSPAELGERDLWERDWGCSKRK